MSVSRRDRILALAWSLPDALRTLEGRNRETRSLSPVAWQLCGTCDGTGSLVDRWGKPGVCPVCAGAGRYRTDPYAEAAERVTQADDHTSGRITTRVERCDRCDGDGVIPGRWIGVSGLVACPSCDGTGRQQVPIADQPGRPTGDEFDSETWAWKGGDWDALDGALERMRSNGRRPLWRAFVVAYVEPPYRVSEAAEHGLQAVETLMPPRVRVPAEVVTAWCDRSERARLHVAKRAERMGRDHVQREIRAALKLGHDEEHVAQMFAVPRRRVRALMGREQRERAIQTRNRQIRQALKEGHTTAAVASMFDISEQQVRKVS